jgi:dTDP-4-amino-4,6-dideoxygalactose transaminase
MIPFNKPQLTGKEIQYIEEAVRSGKISGNGMFTQKCQEFFKGKYGFKKCLLTTSCTDALEMAALLINIRTGDEVIMPSYTFVSTAIAFIRQGAVVRFVDSKKDHPCINEDLIEELINSKTRAIVAVHYAGVACDMDKIMNIAEKYGLWVVEDAAQAIDSYYKGKPLGSIGHLGCFSFHETKNIQCGEGGMLSINYKVFEKRAEIIWEKGTNRAEFFRGEVNKYGWVDIGSSFLPSEIISAFLWAQLENLKDIQSRRKQIWENYYKAIFPFAESGKVTLPVIPDYASNNAHMFYIVCPSQKERSLLIQFLKSKKVHAVFHYISLHQSEYYKSMHDKRILIQSDKYTNCLLRLPLFYELNEQMPISILKEYYEKKLI